MKEQVVVAPFSASTAHDVTTINIKNLTAKFSFMNEVVARTLNGNESQIRDASNEDKHEILLSSKQSDVQFM